VIGRREVWEIPGTSSVVHHHEQHEFMAPDMVMLDRRQISQLSVLVRDAAAFTVQVFGAFVHTVNGIVEISSQTINLSTYIPETGALFVNIEADDNGDLSIHEGDNFGSILVSDVSFIPVPQAGKYMIATVLLYEGQATLLDEYIRVPMPLGLVAKSSGLQINEADPGTPANGDLFGFWDVINETLKNITWYGLKSLIDENSRPQNVRYFVDGRLVEIEGIGGKYIADQDQTVEAVYISCDEPGSAGSTVVDVNINGTTIFTTQVNRPTLAYNDSDSVVKSGIPENATLVERDRLTIDIDQVATGAEGLSVVVFLSPVTSAPVEAPLTTSLDAYRPGSDTDNIVLELGTGGSWDDDRIISPSAVTDGEDVHLFYSGNDSSVYKIGVASSPVSGFDGTNFTKYGSNPILSPGTSGAWDDGGVTHPFVLYDPDDGLWKMYYMGISGSDSAIGLATATDPLGPWTKHPSNPVVEPTETWEDVALYSPLVLRESASSWKMLYTGNNPAGPARIGLATSTDGVTWTKYPSNPVLSPSGSGWMAASVFASRTLVKLGGTYHLYFAGKQTELGYSKIGYASSTDLITWTLGSSNPILSPSRAWEGDEVENPNLIQVGATQYLYFDCWFGTPSTIGVVVIP
jgi:predicted GH43/DUF377 family glycosyl hydrolase